MNEDIDEGSRRLFAEQRHRRFGTANPERMDLAHWQWMVRSDLNPYQALTYFGGQLEPTRGPDWCFAQRYGMTETVLPDNRTLYIGGEYEDSYDPEFCIYNDVIVRGPNDHLAIYGYPKTVFPPTDFHSATFVDGQIIVIGRLGHQVDRIPTHTPVYSLDTHSYQIIEIETSGENPGWIFGHSAFLDSLQRCIVLQEGEIYLGSATHSIVPNGEKYQLDLSDWRWRKTNVAGSDQ